MLWAQQFASRSFAYLQLLFAPPAIPLACAQPGHTLYPEVPLQDNDRQEKFTESAWQSQKLNTTFTILYLQKGF